MKKTILHIIPTLDPAGSQRQMSLLARHLPREEFAVHVCALWRGGPLLTELVEAGVPTTVQGARRPLDLAAFLQLRQQVSRLRPDLIHAWRFTATAYGHAVSRLCGVKNVVTTLCPAATRHGWPAWALKRHMARHGSRIVVASSWLRELCLQHGLPSEKTCLIAPGVAPTVAPSSTRRQLLAELALPAESRLVAVVATLRLQRRIKDAIWAADLLKVIRGDVHLLIVGDGPHRDRLRKFRDQSQIGDKVHFLGWRADVPRLLPHCDVFWSTSGQPAQQSAILEAMAAGLPVVASDIPGNRELIVHETNGYLVPVGNRAGFARWTNRILDDAALARRLGDAGQQRVLGEFRAEKMVERYVALYRELLQ